MLQQKVKQLKKQMFKDREPSKAKSVVEQEKKE